MSWHPIHADQVYLASNHYKGIFDSNSINGLLLKLTTNLKTGTYSITSVSKFDVYPNISDIFSWSPDGKVLVGLSVIRPHKTLSHMFQGKLAVSYDGGRTVNLTGIKMDTGISPPVWIDNREFYLQFTEYSIVKVRRTGQDFTVLETSVESDDDWIHLRGCFKGKPVYYKYNGVFVGKDPILKLSGRGLSRLIAGQGYIIAEFNSKVMIFDGHLSLCHTNILDKNTHLLNFNPKTNIVYLLEKGRRILYYDITGNKKKKELFSVDMLHK